MLDKNIIPETIPFDFDETYAAVRNKFSDYGYDLQEGSNTMQLAIAMSYLTSMLNANTAVNINEMLLPVARKRDMVLQDARLLGYEIKHKISYKYKLTLDFPEGTHQVNTYEKFSSDGKSYYYMGDNIPTFEGPKTIELVVTEGNLKEWKKDSSLVTTLSLSSTQESAPVVDYFVDIPYKDVAENGLRVFVSYTEPNGTSHELKEYPRLDNFIIDSDSIGKPGYVRLDNIKFKTPRIYFKLGDVGANLPENTKVYVDCLVSSGSDGKIDTNKISTDLECEVSSVDLVSNGSAEESIESVKRNAPLFHNSANRLVTKNDISSFVNRDNRIKSATVWDGGDEFPRKPGNIWFTGLPQHSVREFVSNELKTKWNLDTDHNNPNWNLTEPDIHNIIEQMDEVRIPTISMHHRHPIYMDFDFKIQVVRYSRSLTPAEWNTKLFDEINRYFESTDEVLGVEEFNFEYFQSSLVKRLDYILSDSTGFNIELSNSVMLSERDILDETINECSSTNPGIDQNKEQVRFHLGTPFEKYIEYSIDNEVLVATEYLPRISALVNGKQLSIDFDSPTLLGNEVMQYPIYLGPKIIGNYVGEYRVFIGTADTIEVVLLTKNADILQAIQNNLKIDITYNSPNFKVTRNTIPALSSVEFIDR